MAESQQRGPLRETARYNTHEAGTLWLGASDRAVQGASSPGSSHRVDHLEELVEIQTESWKRGLMSCALGAFPCFLEVEGSVEIYDMADCPSLSSTVADQQKGKEKLRRSKSQTLSCCTWC
ncbi:uncharacterized [Tachysurus ichikawai]